MSSEIVRDKIYVPNPGCNDGRAKQACNKFVMVDVLRRSDDCITYRKSHYPVEKPSLVLGIAK